MTFRHRSRRICGFGCNGAQPSAFATTLGEKDIRLTLSAAETLRVPMPLASLVHNRLQELIARGGAQLDWAAIAKLAADDAGLR